MFREVGYGAAFLLSTLIAAWFGAMLWGPYLSRGPQEHLWWIVEGAIVGAVCGGGFWLFIKYRYLTPRHR